MSKKTVRRKETDCLGPMAIGGLPGYGNRPCGRRWVPSLVLAAGLMMMSLADPTIAESPGDAAAGKAKAGLCSACHGLAGISANPLWPNLAGQHQAYLAAQIRAYRDGEREEITMQPFVQHLTNQDVEDLAAWYASLTPCP